jgi:hypothetical protein
MGRYIAGRVDRHSRADLRCGCCVHPARSRRTTTVRHNWAGRRLSPCDAFVLVATGVFRPVLLQRVLRGGFVAGLALALAPMGAPSTVTRYGGGFLGAPVAVGHEPRRRKLTLIARRGLAEGKASRRPHASFPDGNGAAYNCRMAARRDRRFGWHQCSLMRGRVEFREPPTSQRMFLGFLQTPSHVSRSDGEARSEADALRVRSSRAPRAASASA